MSADTDADTDHRGRLADLTDRARRGYHDAYDNVRGYSRDIGDRSRRQLDEARLFVDDQFSEHPMTIALGALAVGVALGLLIGVSAARR